jgi:hypothetical protein
VTLILVVEAGVVKVPGLAKTVILVKPLAGNTELTQAVPLDVKTLPFEPADVIPVPPLAIGSVPVTAVVKSA